MTSLQESRDIDPASPFTDYAQLSHGSHTASALVIQGSQDEGLALARRIVTVAQEMGRPVTAHTAQAWIALAVVAQLRHTPDELESILPSAERAVAEATDPFTRVCLHLLRFVSALFRGERPCCGAGTRPGPSPADGAPGAGLRQSAVHGLGGADGGRGR